MSSQENLSAIPRMCDYRQPLQRIVRTAVSAVRSTTGQRQHCHALLLVPLYQNTEADRVGVLHQAITALQHL